jgi:hypothetical protein
MYDHAFRVWRGERDSVEEELQHLIARGPSRSVEERQVRLFQFEALIERREAAARKLMQSDRSLRSAKFG